MTRFQDYAPDQAWLLPPRIGDELGEEHLARFLHEVVETAKSLGLGRLGRVAIDSTRVKAEASPDRSDTVEQLRHERAHIRQRIRRWQQQCDRDEEPSDGVAAPADWRRRLEEIPRQLKQLHKSGQKCSSRRDPDSRYLRRRGGFCLRYTGEVAVSDDHFIVAQRVHQSSFDNDSLVPMMQAVERECGQRPKVILADSRYFQRGQIEQVEAAGVQLYVPDGVLAQALADKAPPLVMTHRQRRRSPGLEQIRERLTAPPGRTAMARRKALVESVFGVLKQQRGMRRFRRRGLAAVSVEWTLAATAYNLTRLYNRRQAAAN